MRTISLSMTDICPVITECINRGSEVILTVTGNSMRPYISHRRDCVVLVKTDGLKLKKGQIPLYKREDGHYVLHRIVKVEKDGTYTMLGDAQTELEYGIKPSQIVALSKAFIRKEKRHEVTSAGYWLYTVIWMALLPIRPFCFKSIYLLGKIFRAFKR